MLEAASYYQIRCRSSATEVEALDANTALLCALAATHRRDLADAMSSSRVVNWAVDSVNRPRDPICGAGRANKLWKFREFRTNTAPRRDKN